MVKERQGMFACHILILKLVTGVYIPKVCICAVILFGNLSVVSAEIFFFFDHLLGIIVTVADGLRNLNMLSTCCGMVSACVCLSV